MIPRCSLAFVMLALFVPSFFAQERTNQSSVFLNPDAPQTCEQNAVSMETLATETLEATKNGGVLIAVASLGTGEQSREFNRRRLYNVREFLKDRASVRPEKIVVAEGERVNGLGRIEFYLGGKVIGRLFLARNKDLCLICCDEYGPYYPHKDNTRDEGKGNLRKRAPSKGRQPVRR